MEWREIEKREFFKELKETDFSSTEWKSKFSLGGENLKVDRIWFLNDWVKKGELIVEALEIADLYSRDKNPEPGYHDLNERLKDGDDQLNIYTVRGTVPWLLQSLISTLKTEYYSRIIDIIERLAIDPVFYVRKQAAVPLSLLAANILAKKNKDGSDFDFKESDRKRVFDLAFRMLRENRDLPRVLEYVSNVFDRLRHITENEAKEVLNTLFYNRKGELNPDYLTTHIAAIVLFYAEYRVKSDKDFKNEWFQNFLIRLIKDSNKSDQRLKGTLIWLVWKQIDIGAESYPLLKKYIPLFFEGDYEDEPVGQFELLSRAVLKVDPQEGVLLFKKELEFVIKGIEKLFEKKQFWFTSLPETVGDIAKLSPKDLVSIFPLVERLILLGAYVGKVEQVFGVYKIVTNGLQESIKKVALESYERIKKAHPEWKLPPSP